MFKTVATFKEDNQLVIGTTSLEFCWWSDTDSDVCFTLSAWHNKEVTQTIVYFKPLWQTELFMRCIVESWSHNMKKETDTAPKKIHYLSVVYT